MVIVSHAKVSMENKGKRKISIKEEEEEEDIRKLVLGIMEGYSDSTIPPLSLFKPPTGFTDSAIHGEVAAEDYSSRKRVKSSENMRERDRRVKMNDSYSLLESIVPGLVPKSTKDKVIQGTIEYIKYLEEEKNILEKVKDSFLGPKLVSFLPTTTTESSNSATVTVRGRVCFFGIECQKRHGLLARIFTVFHSHRAEVLAANISDNNNNNGGKLVLTVTALFHGDESCSVEDIRREILML